MFWLFRRAALAGACAMTISALWLLVTAFDSISMPGRSYKGPMLPLNEQEKTVMAGLKRHVYRLAGTIGERNMQTPAKLDEAARYIEEVLNGAGYKVESQEYVVDGKAVRNLEVILPGTTRPDDVVVVGAHYDSVPNCPGANDNASGLAGVLELARMFSAQRLPRTLRFVAFVNEEDPYFGTDRMGSYQYATRCHNRGENIIGMIAIETIGYHSDRPGTQKLPPLTNLAFPSVGNFVWFVGNLQSKDFLRHCIGSFRQRTPFPSQGVAAPEFIEGVDWCDQLYFWKNGYPGIMVTDSAPYRYPYYHTKEDTPDRIDYERTARIVAGLKGVVEELASRWVLKYSEQNWERSYWGFGV